MRFDCPFCSSNNVKIYRSNQIVRDVRRKNRTFFTCLNCGTIYPQPRISFSEIILSIDKKAGSEVEVSKPLAPFSKTDIDNYSFIINILNKYKEKNGLKNALDIGAFNGCFCYILNHLGFDAYGLEPQSDQVEIAKQRDLKVYQGYFPDNIASTLLGQQYDLITMMEVVYYFEDIKTALKKTHELLSENGICLIKLHHGESHYYEDSSISLFSRYGDQVQSIPTVYSINHWLNKCGFKLLEILPYPDNYYNKFLISDTSLVPRKIKELINQFMLNLGKYLIPYLLFHNKEKVTVNNWIHWTRKVDRIVIVAKKISK